jgi:hypothetical protein
MHPAGVNVLMSGNPAHDAKRYQEKQVSAAIADTRDETKNQRKP